MDRAAIDGLIGMTPFECTPASKWSIGAPPTTAPLSVAYVIPVYDIDSCFPHDAVARWSVMRKALRHSLVTLRETYGDDPTAYGVVVCDFTGTGHVEAMVKAMREFLEVGTLKVYRAEVAFRIPDHARGLNTAIRIAAGHGYDLITTLHQFEEAGPENLLQEFAAAQDAKQHGAVLLSQAFADGLSHRWTSWAFVFLDSGLFAEPLCPAQHPATISWQDYMLTEHGVPCHELAPSTHLDAHSDFLLDFLHSGIPEAATERNPLVALLQTAVTWKAEQGVRTRRFFPDGTWSLPTLLSVAAFGETKPNSVASCARMGATLTPEPDVRPEGQRHAKLQRLALAQASGTSGHAPPPVPAPMPTTGFMGAPLMQAAELLSQKTVPLGMCIASAVSNHMGARALPIVAWFLRISKQSGH